MVMEKSCSQKKAFHMILLSLWRPQSQSTALNPAEDSIEQLVILSFILTLNILEMFPLNGNLFDLPDVKRGLTLKASMLVETIEMYNPDDYPFEMLAKNKEIWIGGHVL